MEENRNEDQRGAAVSRWACRVRGGPAPAVSSQQLLLARRVSAAYDVIARSPPALTCIYLQRGELHRMHHPEPSGENPGSRRMSHPSVFIGRRGSNTGAAPADEQQTPAGSSSPGPHHPPHSLSIPSAGAQVKKKSGFQITSVLPAQMSASGNNSIADDTESYDDMDESHTEDLSSSDILDVSVSRATDTGVPERSSSEETLNSLHGGETPGVVSPNETVMHQGYLVNGIHHQAHHHQGHHKTAARLPAVGPAALSGPVTQAKVADGRAAQAAVVEGGGAPVTAGVVSALPDTGGASVTVTQPPPPSTAAIQTQTSTASRFRVVKLDSNSEPFRKGRWTCAEFYEKDAPPGDPPAAHRTVENIIHSERESTSGSSSGSTLSGGDAQQTHAGPPPQLHAHPHESALLADAAPPPRPQQQVVYGAEGQIPPLQSSYLTKPPVSVALPPMEYSQISANGAQSLQIPPVQSAVSPRAAPLPIGMPPMGVQLFSSTASGPQPALHGAVVQGQQGGRGPPVGVLSGVTASQLEDAQRLLLQHHPLLALPRLAASGGLTGSSVADGGADAVFAVSTGADEDR
ncbi:TSC22 domain family protein 1 [Triplophysa tibetana]|uniref:TSC22 domain family protein 1 n=1 Tax=Triplophysa tibetana TaxID=1572043 RepID=A0A5A9NT18_9TELE|nr:TSC22 domain family protein 1 [Triplophysa tibetana]